MKISLVLIFSFLFAKTISSQKPCYDRINEEASKIDTLQVSSGTGFLINNDGYIVTNRHVIERSRSLSVTFNIANRKVTRTAQIIAWDKNTDLALLKADVKGLFTDQLPYGFNKSQMHLGEKVYTLGFPDPDYLGESIKLTDGIISATSGFQDDKELYQISAPIQPGNSGSPMFDNNGNIRGVIVATFTKGQNVNYSIKAEYLNKILSSEKISLPAVVNNSGFKSRLGAVQKRICLIENTAIKTFYKEFAYSDGKIYSESESMFSMQRKCFDVDFRKFIDNNVPLHDARKSNVESNDWIDKVFPNNYARALYYSYYTNLHWNGQYALPKFYFYNEIGAYDNIIQEHNLKFSFQNGINDEGWFSMYLGGGFFELYEFAIIMKYSYYDNKEIIKHLKYINALIMLVDKYLEGDKEIKANLLVSKANIIRLLMPIGSYFNSESEACQIVREARILNPKVEVFFESFCK